MSWANNKQSFSFSYAYGDCGTSNFLLVKNRQKVTLKEKGEHFDAKFLLFKERSSRFRRQIGFSYALSCHLWLLPMGFEVFSIDMSQVMPNLLCSPCHFGCITKWKKAIDCYVPCVNIDAK